MSARAFPQCMHGGVAMNIAAWLAALALVALPLVGVTNGWFASDRWPFRSLKIDAEFRRVNAEQVRSAAAPQLARGFFAVDLAAVQDAIEQVPWVERAEVRKHWPDVLEVRISEHRPFARWGKDRLLSEQGRLFPASTVAVPRGLPLLDGPESRVAEVVALYNQARERLADAGGVRGVALDKRGSWSISLHNGTEVVLGRSDPEARLERFAPLLPRLVAQHPGQRLARADLRYTNGFSLTWVDLPKPPKTTAPLPQPLAMASRGVPSPQPSPASGRGSKTNRAINGQVR